MISIFLLSIWHILITYTVPLQPIPAGKCSVFFPLLAQGQSEVWTWSERPKGDISAVPTGMGSWCPPIVTRLERSGQHMLKWGVHGGKLQDHIERNKHKWSPGYHSMHPSMIWVRGQLTGNLQVIPRYPKGMFVSKTSSGHPSSVNRFDSSCLWPTHIHLGL